MNNEINLDLQAGMFHEKLIETPERSVSAVERLVSLPVYESTAAPEQREQKLKFMSFQLSMIKEQSGWGMAADKTTVKCGCHKQLKLIYAYRCLYCGILK